MESDIDFLHDNETSAVQEVDTATAVAAQIFDSAPLKTSFSKAAYIKAQVEIEKQLDGAENFIRLDNSDKAMSRTNQQQEADEKFFAYVAEVMADIEGQRRREREEWARTVSSVGGVSMTGAEWAELGERLRNDEALREKVMESLRQRGLSEEEAKARYEKITRIAEIAAIPPSQRTPEQQQVIGQAEADPDFQQDMQEITARTQVTKLSANLSAPTVMSQTSTPSEPSAPAPVTKVADLGL